MTRSRQLLLAAAVAILAAVAGFAAHLWRLTGDGGSADAIMALRLPDLAGQEQPLSQWHGKVVVVNFWATWCAPCREEVPAFVRLQEQYASQGVQFVGIAVDQRDKVASFAREFGINYAILLGGIDTIDLTRKAGNRVGALPFTLVLDRRGEIATRELGVVREADLERLLQKLLRR